MCIRDRSQSAGSLDALAHMEAAEIADICKGIGMAKAATLSACLLYTSPAIMECFDISNVSSNHIVASMVRFTNGKPDTKAYRRYRIRTVDGQNDFASMSEVIRLSLIHISCA